MPVFAAHDQDYEKAVMAYFTLAGFQISQPITVTATAYDACVHCCKKTDGITKSGTKATPRQTIAVDPNIIPLGTRVFIEGMGIYTAEDIGSTIKGNRIDIFMESHQQAINFGSQTLKIYVIEEKTPRI
ncbi:MAG: 3D domain-containing protein [Dehalobacterium sp.]